MRPQYTGQIVDEDTIKAGILHTDLPYTIRVAKRNKKHFEVCREPMNGEGVAVVCGYFRWVGQAGFDRALFHVNFLKNVSNDAT